MELNAKEDQVVRREWDARGTKSVASNSREGQLGVYYLEKNVFRIAIQLKRPTDGSNRSDTTYGCGKAGMCLRKTINFWG